MTLCDVCGSDCPPAELANEDGTPVLVCLACQDEQAEVYSARGENAAGRRAGGLSGGRFRSGGVRRQAAKFWGWVR